MRVVRDKFVFSETIDYVAFKRGKLAEILLEHPAHVLCTEWRKRGGGDEAVVRNLRMGASDERGYFRADGGERREFLGWKFAMEDGAARVRHGLDHRISGPAREAALRPSIDRRMPIADTSIVAHLHPALDFGLSGPRKPAGTSAFFPGNEE